MAQAAQTLLDEQIESLSKSARMRKFLTEQKDVLPCANENKQHTRRILEILLTRNMYFGKLFESQGWDIVTFRIVKGSCPARSFKKPAQEGALSQLSFQKDMLEVNYYFLTVFRERSTFKC